jgi:mRNA interferase MazF
MSLVLMERPRAMQRGEIFRLRLPVGRKGHEQRGARYGVVVQAGDLFALSTVVVAPTSTSAKPASFRPEVTVKGVKTRVLVDQLTAVDRHRLGVSAGVVTWNELAELDSALGSVLGLRR